MWQYVPSPTHLSHITNINPFATLSRIKCERYIFYKEVCSFVIIVDYVSAHNSICIWIRIRICICIRICIRIDVWGYTIFKKYFSFWCKTWDQLVFNLYCWCQFKTSSNHSLIFETSDNQKEHDQENMKDWAIFPNRVLLSYLLSIDLVWFGFMTYQAFLVIQCQILFLHMFQIYDL